MAGLVPAIHAFLVSHAAQTWMPAPSAGMTEAYCCAAGGAPPCGDCRLRAYCVPRLAGAGVDGVIGCGEVAPEPVVLGAGMLR